MNLNSYQILKKQVFSKDGYSIVPIRKEDKYLIMEWRNEQIFHLRQSKPLTKNDQDYYFNTVIAKLFEQKKPDQILFSFLQEITCIGYGGLVHIDWINKNAELSFIMDTSLQNDYFKQHWIQYLALIEDVAFNELKLHKIYTYAYDLRPYIYPIFESRGFKRDATLRDDKIIENNYVDVVIHSKINKYE